MTRSVPSVPSLTRQPLTLSILLMLGLRTARACSEWRPRPVMMLNGVPPAVHNTRIGRQVSDGPRRVSEGGRLTQTRVGPPSIDHLGRHVRCLVEVEAVQVHVGRRRPWTGPDLLSGRLKSELTDPITVLTRLFASKGRLVSAERLTSLFERGGPERTSSA